MRLHGRQTIRTDARAFTLIEMLVAVAVLAVMIVIFGAILSHVNAIMNISQENIQADRECAAIAALVQKDLARVSRNSYIRVSGGNRLCVQVVGNYESLLAADSGTVSSAAARNSGTVNCASSTTWSTNAWQGAMLRFDDRKFTGTFSAVTPTTGTNTTNPTWISNTWVGSLVQVTGGQGAGLQRMVVGNTADTMTVDPPWGEQVAPGGGDLLIYCTFDQGDAKDYSGNNNHGALDGATFAAGQVGQAAVLGGSNKVYFPSTSMDPITTTNKITIMMWVYGDSQTPNTQGWMFRVLGQPIMPGGKSTYWIGTGLGWDYADGGGFHSKVTVGGRDTYAIRNYNCYPNGYSTKWSHVAVVKDGDWVGMYYDGVLDAQRYKSASYPWGDFVPGITNVHLGGDVHGKFDSLMVWRTALTTAEVQAYADNPSKSPIGDDIFTGEGPDAGSTYALYFPTYPVSSSGATSLSLGQNLWGDVPAGTPYSVYFSSNAALIDYGRIYDGSNPNGMLWRRVQLLVPGAAASRDDVIRVAPGKVTNATYDAYCTAAPVITLPPEKFADWWAYMAGQCTDLSTAVYVYNTSNGTGAWSTNWSSDGKAAAEVPTAIKVTFTLRGRKTEVIANIN